MKKYVLAILAGVVLLTSGCASVQTSKLDTMPTAKEDRGLVYFYRESKFAGWAVSYDVYDGESKIGGLTNGSFFYYEAEPGEHVFWAKTEAKDEVKVDVKAGEVYYVSGEVDMGFLVGRPDLSLVDHQEGSSEINGLEYVTLSE